MFAFSRRKRRERETAQRLYDRVVGWARSPFLYAIGGVPDTVDGRFEMVVLHTYFVVGRLMAGDEGARKIAQLLFDTMITDMDRSLREMGVGDLSVGRKVKAMAEAYYGRSKAYDAALVSGDEDLAEALLRNVFGTVLPESGNADSAVEGMVQYVRSTVRNFSEQSLEALTEGDVQFIDYSRATGS